MHQFASRIRLVAALVALLPVFAAPARAADAPVRVLSMPAALDADGMLELAAEMRLADSSAVVLVHGPANARVTGRVDDGVIVALLSAARDVQLDVLVEPGSGDAGDAAAFVSAFGDRLLVLPGASLGALKDRGLRERVDHFSGCRVPCLPAESIADGAQLQNVLGAGIALDGTLAQGTLPTPGHDRGIGPLLAAAAAVILVGLVLGLLAGRRPRRAPRSAPRAAVPAARPAARHARSRRRLAAVADAALPGSGRALVRTDLHPEGYVELDGCLRRARWSSPGEPPAAGEWVHVESKGGRLVAHRGRSR